MMPAFSSTRLLLASLRFHWRIGLAVLLATAVAVAVLTGSLLVGASVRASLRDLALERLGRIEQSVIAETFFREQLVESIPDSAGAILLQGSITHAESGARAARVQALGVDQSFWQLGDAAVDWAALGDSDAVLNAPLARELGAKLGDEILLRIQKPSAIPAESFVGERDETVATFRYRVAQVLREQGLADFSLGQTQAQPLNLFITRGLIQRRLEQPGRINALFTAQTGEAAEHALRGAAQLTDLGLKINAGASTASLQTARIFFPEQQVAAALKTADALQLTARPTLTYVTNLIQTGSRSIPYSTITALDDLQIAPGDVMLNAWAADDLQAAVGDPVTLTYYVQGELGELRETSVTLRLAGVVPMDSPLASRGLAPDFPGVAEADSISNWEAPFPIDMTRIRTVDEDYWDTYRATPKAYVALATGQGLWGNRFGNLTSIRLEGARLAEYPAALLSAMDPAQTGLALRPVRALALQASQGASDFGGLFIGFSFFLLISAAMLIWSLFLLNIESRSRQFGLLSAVGFSRRRIRALLLAEGALIALPGAVLGVVGGIGFAALMIHGLRTWWVGAIGTPFLKLAIDPLSLGVGFAGGMLVALFSIWRAARRLGRLEVRGLLAGRAPEHFDIKRRGRLGRVPAVVLVLLALGMAAAAPFSPARVQAGLCFGAGGALLVAALAILKLWLTRETQPSAAKFTLNALGFSAARRRPGRSMLVAGLMACAVFVIVAAGANRHRAGEATDRQGGSGGFALLAESTLPLFGPLDPQTLQGAESFALRLRPGDDTSCLNLYRVSNPRILGVPDALIARGGFAFASTLADDTATQANPWLLLQRPLADGAIPVFGDQSTVMWLLHLGLGQDFMLGKTRLRFVGLLKGSIFQGELLMADSAFEKLFPEQPGWRYFLIDTPPAPAAALGTALEAHYEDYGLDAVGTRQKLEALMAVENTYLSTFQALGGLGLLLGTCGLGLALLRNLLERRAEFALLRALGFRTRNLVRLALLENVLLLAIGMLTGAVCALLAIAPALLSRSVEPPWLSLALTLGAIFVCGVAAIAASAAAVLRAPPLQALKEE